jgi:hypothetical protein
LNSDLKNKKPVCEYCQANIKDESFIVHCPECNTPYHIECWTENGGCAVYGCNYKITTKNSENVTIESIEDVKINVQYLINENRYIEAITECKRLLKTDKRNTDLKKLYNSAVHLINTRTKFLENGDNAFNSRDYKSAEIYYNNAYKYLDDESKEFYSSRLSIIKEKIPLERKRKIRNSLLISFICILILGALGYLYYYFYFLEEERAFAEIERGDDVTDVQITEMQISKYENFIRRYQQSDLKEKAHEKVNYFSGVLAADFSDEDWRNAYRYLNKVDETKSPKTFKDIYSKIYSKAKEEFNTKISNVKKLDSQKKFTEAKSQLESAVEISDMFPNSDLRFNSSTFNYSLSLLNKKISSLARYASLNEEITQKYEELKKYGETTPVQNTVEINAKVVDYIDPSTVTAKLTESGRLIAIRTSEINLRPGENVNLLCSRSGNIEIIDKNNESLTIPLYIQNYSGNIDFSGVSGSSDNESIRMRIEYLREQKMKIDSLLNLGLKL